MRKIYYYTNFSRTAPETVGRSVQEDRWMSRTGLVKRPLLLFGSILIGLLLLAIACDWVPGRLHDGSSAVLGATSRSEGSPSADKATVNSESGGENGSGFLQLFSRGLDMNGETANWRETVSTMAFRLTLAALLGGVVAFRPRKFLSPRRRNPYVVQTQILLAVVACAMMIIVGDSAARAFGIFAAASLVRFRTNIRDPKETTVLLVTLGVGLAAGVGRWELAAMFALFILVLLQALEWYERRQVVNLMELSVRTHDVEATDGAVRELFKRNNYDVGTTELNKESEKNPLGKVVYSLDLKAKFNTDRLAEDVYLADPANINRIELHRRKQHSNAQRG